MAGPAKTDWSFDSYAMDFRLRYLATSGGWLGSITIAVCKAIGIWDPLFVAVLAVFAWVVIRSSRPELGMIVGAYFDLVIPMQYFLQSGTYGPHSAHLGDYWAFYIFGTVLQVGAWFVLEFESEPGAFGLVMATKTLVCTWIWMGRTKDGVFLSTALRRGKRAKASTIPEGGFDFVPNRYFFSGEEVDEGDDVWEEDDQDLEEEEEEASRDVASRDRASDAPPGDGRVDVNVEAVERRRREEQAEAKAKRERERAAAERPAVETDTNPDDEDEDNDKNDEAVAAPQSVDIPVVLPKAWPTDIRFGNAKAELRAVYPDKWVRFGMMERLKRTKDTDEAREMYNRWLSEGYKHDRAVQYHTFAAELARAQMQRDEIERKRQETERFVPPDKSMFPAHGGMAYDPLGADGALCELYPDELAREGMVQALYELSSRKLAEKNLKMWRGDTRGAKERAERYVSKGHRARAWRNKIRNGVVPVPVSDLSHDILQKLLGTQLFSSDRTYWSIIRSWMSLDEQKRETKLKDYLAPDMDPAMRSLRETQAVGRAEALIYLYTEEPNAERLGGAVNDEDLNALMAHDRWSRVQWVDALRIVEVLQRPRARIEERAVRKILEDAGIALELKDGERAMEKNTAKRVWDTPMEISHQWKSYPRNDSYDPREDWISDLGDGKWVLEKPEAGRRTRKPKKR